MRGRSFVVTTSLDDGNTLKQLADGCSRNALTAEVRSALNIAPASQAEHVAFYMIRNNSFNPIPHVSNGCALASSRVPVMVARH